MVRYDVLVHVVLQTLFLLLMWDKGKVRDRFGGLVRIKAGLKGKSTV